MHMRSKVQCRIGYEEARRLAWQHDILGEHDGIYIILKVL